MNNSAMITLALFDACRIGAIHARNAADHPAARLRYVVDPNRDAAERLAAATGAVVANPQSAFADGGVDGVIIASATDTHAELIERACKQVLALF